LEVSKSKLCVVDFHATWYVRLLLLRLDFVV
jgi:hypothetical protein